MITAQSDARRLLRPAALILVTITMLALTACDRGSAGDEHPAEGTSHAEHAEGETKDEGHNENEGLTLTSEEAERAGVKVEVLKAQVMSDEIIVTATIQPDADKLARVAPRIEGRITSVPAKLGHSVLAGQVLATLDSAEVGEAHAAWAQAQSELRIAEADFKRAKELVADEIIPRKDFLRARSDRDKATASLRAATDKLRLLRGGTEASADGITSFAVTAPFAGTVIERTATLGELGRPGASMFTIADLSQVWIQADLPEAALGRVRIGAGAKVSVSAYPGEVFTGRVDYIGAVFDKDSRTVAARIVAVNIDGRLKPEMFATATIEAGGRSSTERREVLSLPDAAIVIMQSQPTVFVYEHGAYEMRVIEPGERSGGRTVVRGGLKDGDQVVTEGAYELKARKLKSQLGHGH